jgi:hypothetical protein
MVEGF